MRGGVVGDDLFAAVVGVGHRQRTQRRRRLPGGHRVQQRGQPVGMAFGVGRGVAPRIGFDLQDQPAVGLRRRRDGHIVHRAHRDVGDGAHRGTEMQFGSEELEVDDGPVQCVIGVEGAQVASQLIGAIAAVRAYLPDFGGHRRHQIVDRVGGPDTQVQRQDVHLWFDGRPGTQLPIGPRHSEDHIVLGGQRGGVHGDGPGHRFGPAVAHLGASGEPSGGAMCAVPGRLMRGVDEARRMIVVCATVPPELGVAVDLDLGCFRGERTVRGRPAVDCRGVGRGHPAQQGRKRVTVDAQVMNPLHPDVMGGRHPDQALITQRGTVDDLGARCLPGTGDAAGHQIVDDPRDLVGVRGLDSPQFMQAGIGPPVRSVRSGGIAGVESRDRRQRRG